MDYSLLPFPTLSTDADYSGRPDLRESLRTRESGISTTRIANLELLDHVVECLRELPWRFFIDHCREQDGLLYLAVMAMDLGRNLDVDDQVTAGFFLQNSESSKVETIACSRIYRVDCQNGALVECEKGQSFTIASSNAKPADWQEQIRCVINRSFDGAGIDVDVARFRATTQKMIITPYELLCHLLAQGLIDDDEQSNIQTAFDEAADFTMYGFINAVTQVAHRLRSNDRWARAFHFERLGGEILRGDHNLPSLDPAFSR